MKDDPVGFFIKVATETETKAIASGKRSAILIDKSGKLFRFKGCGNELKGFNI